MQRWHDAFRAVHGKIPSRSDLNKDPELLRNQMRLDHRSKQLRGIGISEPYKEFRNRNLKPKHDMRRISIPKRPQTAGFDVIELTGALDEGQNMALDMVQIGNPPLRDTDGSAYVSEEVLRRKKYKYYEQVEGHGLQPN